MIGRRLLAAAGVLALTACGTPVTGPEATSTPSVTAGPSRSASTTEPSPSPSSSAPSPSASQSRTPTPAQTPDLPAEQKFSLDDVAEYDDGVLIEIAGVAADKARKSEKGAEGTKGQIVIASVRVENGSKHNFDAKPMKITVFYGAGVPAAKLKGGQLQPGFSSVIEPADENIATVAFAVPRSQLAKVTFFVDPDDDEHDPVSFTGKVRRI